MTSNTTISQSLVFDDVHWSNKFKADSFSRKWTAYNAEISSLTNLKTYNYINDEAKVLRVLQNEKICEAQAKRLISYLRFPEKYLKLDVDYLTIIFDCSRNSVIEKLFGEKGIMHVQPIAKSKVLSVLKEPDVGRVNLGKNKDADAVFYNHRFTLSLFKIPYKRIQLYVADGADGIEQKQIRLDIIPSRFNEFELQIFFNHIRSAVGHRVFSQLMNQAVCERIDIGFNLPGVSQLFLIPDHSTNSSVSAGKSFPENDSIAETTYIGDKARSNHFIVYDKILKEVKFHARNYGWYPKKTKLCFNDCLTTSRIERRHWFNRERINNGKGRRPNAPMPLSTLKDVKISFEDLCVFNPKLLSSLTDSQLKLILHNKSFRSFNDKQSPAWTELLEIEEEQKHYSFGLKSSWFNNEKEKLIQHLVSTISLQTLEKTISANQYDHYYAWWLSTPTNTFFNYDVPELSIVPKDKKYKAWERAKTSRQALTVVYGGAGTGKTRLLVEHVNWLVEYKRIKARKIACLSYTNKAADEMQERLAKNPKVYISTFTAWCGITLKNGIAKYKNYRYLAWDDSDNKRVPYLIKELGITPDVAKSVDKILSIASKSGKSPSKIAQLEIGNKDVLAGIATYTQHKKECELWDYDDVLQLLNLELKKETFLKTVKSCYTHLLLDEMQDSNRTQIRILDRLIAAGIRVFMVGDTSQSIYGFRGSNPKWVDKLVDDHHAEPINLRRQHRASYSILKLTNFVRGFTGSSNNRLTTYNGNADSKPMMLVAKRLKDAFADLTSVLDSIKTNDVLVLARTNNQVDHIRKELAGKIGRDHIVTMHKSKGLECEVCVVIDPRFTGSIMDSKLEYLRLMYTALTRPSKHLIIVKCDSSNHFYRDGEETDTDILDIISNIPDLCDLKV